MLPLLLAHYYYITFVYFIMHSFLICARYGNFITRCVNSINDTLSTLSFSIVDNICLALSSITPPWSYCSIFYCIAIDGIDILILVLIKSALWYYESTVFKSILFTMLLIWNPFRWWHWKINCEQDHKKYLVRTSLSYIVIHYNRT